MGSLDEFVQNVRQWAADRDIDTQGTSAGQMEKVEEEVGELREATENLQLDFHNHGEARQETLEAMADAVGDTVVTLVCYCEVTGTDFLDACWAAWNEIKDRKGKMVNGVFVKEST